MVLSVATQDGVLVTLTAGATPKIALLPENTEDHQNNST
jgi:hypothetical protein